MPTLIAFPILGVLLILQSSLVRYVPLIRGTPDLILLALAAWSLQKKVHTAWQWGIIGALMMEIASALPNGVALLGYGLATGLGLALRQRVWQLPFLAMLVVTFTGTLAFHILSILALRVTGNPLPIIETLNLVTLPSLLLNLLLALPMYAVLSDLAGVLHTEELEV